MALGDWSALILAAGAGRRFGGAKLLADLGGAPVIRRTADAAASQGFAEVVVATGAHHAGIKDALDGTGCRIVQVADWHCGMAASLRAGLAALVPGTHGALVFLGDMPLVPVHLCAQLAAMASAAGYAARPLVAGKPGHPAAFMRCAFADLAGLTGDSGANRLLARRGAGVTYLATDDAGAVMDIDAPGDLAMAEQAWNSRATSATSESAISRGDLPNP